jgi:hypothetical protein
VSQATRGGRPEGRVGRLFAIDLRALAALRIAFAGLLALDLALRARDLVAHYTDRGVLPRDVLAADPLGRWLGLVSFHLQGGSAAFEAALFALAFAAAGSMLVGLHTRAAAVTSWLLLISLQNRNPLVHYGGDNLLALVLFFACLLPLGARWSLDARRDGKAWGPGAVLSVAGAALLVQIAAVHFFSVFHKTAPEWWPDGTALGYALHMEKFARPFGVWLRAYSDATRALSYATLVVEGLGSLLLFSPFATTPLRALATAGFVGFHFGIFLCLDLMLFSWISLAAFLVFLPSPVWDRVEGALLRRLGPRAPQRPPAPAPRPSPRLEALAGAALAWVLAWNVVTVDAGWQAAWEAHPVGSAIAFPGLMLRLGQTWNLFAPAPSKETRWHAVVGILDDGRRVDLLRRRMTPPRLGRPASRADFYPSARWERLFGALGDFPYGDAKTALGRYYCRSFAEWGPRGATLRSVRLFVLREENHPGGAPRRDPPRRVATFHCGAPEDDA